MNFLAHFHLAWPDEGLVAGGLEGDFYKGPMRGDLPPAIERGVKLHRAIDAYTDNHPLIQQLRRDLPQGLRRYTGILIDLCFDHFLSLHWATFSDIPLSRFNEGVYRSLSTHEHALSDGSRKMLARLVEYDILGLYLDWDTVPATAARIGTRFKRHNPFEDIDRELAPAKHQLEQAFLAFYPQLQAFSAEREILLNQSAPRVSNIAPGAKSP
jgi:acyl carrier protein phosphodiesterase